MTYPILFEAVLQAVMTWPDEPGRPNTVQAVASLADIEAPPTFEAYRAGHFWSRAWVAQGAPPSSVAIQRPVVSLERKQLAMESPYKRGTCTTVWVAIIDDPCATCGAAPETEELLARRLLSTLARLVRRVSLLSAWRLASGQVVVARSAPAPDAVLLSDRLIEEAGPGGLLLSMTELGLNSGLSASVPLEVCGCELLGDEEFVPYTRPPGLGEPGCALC